MYATGRNGERHGMKTLDKDELKGLYFFCIFAAMTSIMIGILALLSFNHANVKLESEMNTIRENMNIVRGHWHYYDNGRVVHGRRNR